MKKSTFAAIVIFLTGFSGILLAENSYKTASSGDADIKVLGTSNLHGWTMEAKDVVCSADFVFLPGENLQPKSLTSLNLSVVTAAMQGVAQEITINREVASAGWFMTKNIMLKVEYVNQEYKGFAAANILIGGKFKGEMVEASIGF